MLPDACYWAAAIIGASFFAMIAIVTVAEAWAKKKEKEA